MRYTGERTMAGGLSLADVAQQAGLSDQGACCSSASCNGSIS